MIQEKCPSIQRKSGMHEGKDVPRHRNPFATWKEEFCEDRCVEERDLWSECAVVCFPYCLLFSFICAYVVLGAFAFSLLDEQIGKHPFHKICLFTFTTLCTIGYGDVAPSNDHSKILCVVYSLFGVPILFLSLANIGQMLSEGYWILYLSWWPHKKVDQDRRRSIPIYVTAAILLLLSVVGGGIFCYWIDEMTIIPAIYFCFVTVTTIGFGDIVPTPENGYETCVMIAFTALGMVVMSIFVSSLSLYLQKIHYLGNKFSGTRHVQVWFGGEKMSVSELVEMVSQQFGVSPHDLHNVLTDLDKIIKMALNNQDLRKRSQMLLASVEDEERLERAHQLEVLADFEKGLREHEKEEEGEEDPLLPPPVLLSPQQHEDTHPLVRSRKFSRSTNDLTALLAQKKSEDAHVHRKKSLDFSRPLGARREDPVLWQQLQALQVLHTRLQRAASGKNISSLVIHQEL